MNFSSNTSTYGHNLLAYERDARGCNYVSGYKFAPGYKLCTWTRLKIIAILLTMCSDFYGKTNQYTYRYHINIIFRYSSAFENEVMTNRSLNYLTVLFLDKLLSVLRGTSFCNGHFNARRKSLIDWIGWVPWFILGLLACKADEQPIELLR